MRHIFAIALVALLAGLPAAPSYALDKVDPYICPTMMNGTGTECFLEAVPQTYTMCRQIKSIEIIEFGLNGAQQGVNGAKTESCIDKHKLSITRPYQAALREAARNKDEVIGIRKLYDTWLESLAKLTPGGEESDDNYKQRVTRPYGEFNEQITSIKTLAAVVPKSAPTKHAATTATTKSPAASAPTKSPGATAPAKITPATATAKGAATTVPAKSAATTAPAKSTATTAPAKHPATAAPVAKQKDAS